MKRYVKIIALLAVIAITALAASACSIKKIDSGDTKSTEAPSSQNADTTRGQTQNNESQNPVTSFEALSGGDSTEKQTESSEPKQTETPGTTKAPDEKTESPDTKTPETTSQGGAGRDVAELPANAEETFARTVFVGDSICSGFRVYGVMPDNNCLAVGNVGARSIFDYKFKVNGVEYDLITAIKLVDPSFVVFSMGMNDINITSAEQYCANYDDILAKVHAAVPNAKLFVASITPTYNAPSFTNARIDSFNQAISAHLAGSGYYYIDVNSTLKDQATNSLVSTYHSGDGIHLSPAAYEIFKSVVYSYFKSIGVAS